MRLEITRSTLIWKLLHADNPVFAAGPSGSGYATPAKLAGASEGGSSLCCRGAGASPERSVILEARLLKKRCLCAA